MVAPRLVASRLAETANPRVRVRMDLRELEDGERDVLLWPMVQGAEGWVEAEAPTPSELDLVGALADRVAGMEPDTQAAFVKKALHRCKRRFFKRCGAPTHDGFDCLLKAKRKSGRCQAHESEDAGSRSEDA